MQALAHLVYLITQPSHTPIRRITVYYVVLFGASLALSTLVPGWDDWLASWQPASLPSADELGTVLTLSAEPARPIAAWQLVYTLSSVIALMIPISWGYMSTRIRTGFDQSVVQTMLILPVAVAGIVVVVQNSIALAFSLAGIVAAVRFRNTLSDTADALYIFAAIGVGLAGGTGEIAVAAVVSVFFNYIVLTLWHCDYGVCPKAGPVPAYSSGTLTAIEEKSSRKKQKKKKKNHKKQAQPEATPGPDLESAAASTERPDPTEPLP